MSITEKQAAQAINYLYAAQAINVTDAQAAVWADYANTELPDVNAAELLPAARRALKDWAANSRSWKVDLPRYVHTIRILRSERVRSEVQTRGQIHPPEELDVMDDLAWKRVAVGAIAKGESREVAEAAAWAHIGQRPPPVEPTTHHQIPTIGKEIH